jgi:WD40 repeat protein
MKLFDIRKMETIYTLNEDVLHQYCESNISVSSDKKYIAVGSTKGQIFVLNALTGKLEETIDNKSTGSISAVQWRPYHSQIYVGDSLGGLSVWGTN